MQGIGGGGGGDRADPTHPAPATYSDSFPIDMGIPLTPRSPRPNMREPRCPVSIHATDATSSMTIRDYAYPRFVNSGPIPKDCNKKRNQLSTKDKGL